jgi:hypothetical protein
VGTPRTGQARVNCATGGLSYRTREQPAANMLSLGRHPEGILRALARQGLHRSSPLTTGVIAGVGPVGGQVER